MSKKKKKDDNHIVLTIPIETDEYLRKFILDNAFMYNKIRNDFAEEANKYKGEYNMYREFNPRKFKTEYYNTVEVAEHRYDYYCTGLSEQVSENFVKSTKAIRTSNEKVFNHESSSDLGEYHYKPFDYNRYTFRVKLKPLISSYTNRVCTRLLVTSKRQVKFVIRTTIYNKTCNREREEVYVNLKEDLYDDIIVGDNPLFTKYYGLNNKNRCSFLLSDIKDICFKYECGKYYILLFINATYDINKKSRKYSKDRICGIDTGIRHPVTLYDGEKTMYLSMDDKTTRKIHYLERRIGRIQKVLNRKWQYNFDHGLCTHSNNIIKLVKKIRKLYRKITNIKNYWIQNRCKEIATTYKAIVVDRFVQPDKNTKKDLPKIVQRRINYANRFHKMFYFNEFLKHDCIKYGCKYIESPEDTTRTCSVCGYINEHPNISEKYIRCNSCGNVIERDMNAAKNCYYYLLDNM